MPVTGSRRCVFISSTFHCHCPRRCIAHALDANRDSSLPGLPRIQAIEEELIFTTPALQASSFKPDSWSSRSVYRDSGVRSGPLTGTMLQYLFLRKLQWPQRHKDNIVTCFYASIRSPEGPREDWSPTPFWRAMYKMTLNNHASCEQRVPRASMPISVNIKVLSVSLSFCQFHHSPHTLWGQQQHHYDPLVASGELQEHKHARSRRPIGDGVLAAVMYLAVTITLTSHTTSVMSHYQPTIRRPLSPCNTRLW